MWFRAPAPRPDGNADSVKNSGSAESDSERKSTSRRFEPEDATQRSAGVEPSREAWVEDEPTRGAAVEVRTEASGAFPRAGAVVGGTYRVLSEIGRGAMGVVFSAFDQKLERTVAIKLIRAELLDEGFRQRFMQEARVMAQINHPNVVCIHSFGEHHSIPYFVMELVEGTNLEQWHRRCGGPPDVDLALKILGDVCLGVSALHAAGAVHRDLKPSNILLDAQFRSRVADFGVAARAIGGDGSEVVGTPGYMAPEAVLSEHGQKAPAPPSDVYSLGCIAYELLTGVHPFRKRGEPLWTVVPPRAEKVVLPSRHRSDLSSAFDRVLLQALEWDTAGRTASVEDFRRGLIEANAGSGTPARILVAEDDEEFRNLIELSLRREFPGADVECVGNGISALQALERQPASVALIDLQMPAMDGVDLTAQIRAREACANMPIIVLTASGGAREWQRLSTMGADRFLVKPIQLDDVVTFIRQVVRERSRKSQSSPFAAPEPLTVGRS